MIKLRVENTKEFEICNIIQWQKRGYTGKGVKIAIFEDIDQSHAYDMVSGVIKQIAPDAELIVQHEYLGTSNNNSEYFRNFIDRCIAEKVHIITCSYEYSAYDVRLEYVNKAIAAGILFFQSAGNENDLVKSSMLVAKCPGLIVVTGVKYTDKTNKTESAKYCYGEQVDLAMYTYIWTENGTLGTGTSTSTPMTASMAALAVQMLNGDTAAAYEILISKVIDLGTPGEDLYYGLGLPTLPDVDETIQKYTRIVGQIGNNVLKVGNKEVTMDTAPFIQDGRTFVPIRFIAENMNCTVEWKEDTKEFIITRQ